MTEMREESRMDAAYIDYLAIRFRSIENPTHLFNTILGIEESRFVKSAGRYGYHMRYSFGGIAVYADGSKSMGLLLEMGGSGCGEYCAIKNDNNALIDLLFKLDSDDKVTRLDLAFDDLSGLLSIEAIKDKLKTGMVKTKLKEETETNSCTIRSRKDLGKTIYLGSSTSIYRIRIYDKAAEQRMEDGTHWIRVEEVLRKEEASRFVQCFLSLVEPGMSQDEQQDLFVSLGAGLLQKKLTFIEERKSNISRSRVSDWWKSFLETATSVCVLPFSRPAKIEKTESWIRSSIAATIVALILILGADWFISVLCKGLKKNKQPNSPYIAYKGGASCAPLNVDEEDFLRSIEQAILKRLSAAP